jgi:hypothetical protein
MPIQERLSELSSCCVMSIETLNTAVHAAGFAMATSDEPADDPRRDKLFESEAWRPGEAVLLSPDEAAVAKAAPTIAERLKGVFGLLSRGAPA